MVSGALGPISTLAALIPLACKRGKISLSYGSERRRPAGTPRNPESMEKMSRNEGV